MTMEAQMENEKSKAEQEQKAESDARNGWNPDPNMGQFYQDAYNYYKKQYAPPPPQEQAK